MQKNTELLEIFKNLHKKDMLSHAYLFFGPKHAPKSDLALELAQHIESANVTSSQDVTLVDTLRIPQCWDPPAGGRLSKIGIEEIREIRKFLSQTPRGKKRIVIIENAEHLTWQAMPALLKIVEEPPTHALIIFTAREKQSLSPALLSRLAKIYIPPTNSMEEPFRTPRRAGKTGLGMVAVTQAFLERTLEEDVRKGSEPSLAEVLEQRIIELYKKDKIKNTKKIAFLLHKHEMATRFNLNPKLQTKAINHSQNS